MKFKVVVLTIFMVLALPSVAMANTLQMGSTGPEVKTVQSVLSSEGYSVGAVDGIYGIHTKQGVIEFQAAHDLVADGFVGPITMRAIKMDSIIAEAKSHIGLPYVWGGTSPVSGFDCSGFVQYVYGKNGITLPRVSEDQSKEGLCGVSIATLEPGDLVFFSSSPNGSVVSHVGIYLGNGQFIGAESAGVRIVDMTTSYWTSRFVTARRVY